MQTIIRLRTFTAAFAEYVAKSTGSIIKRTTLAEANYRKVEAWGDKLGADAPMDSLDAWITPGATEE